MNEDRKLKIAIIGTRGIPARYGGFETCVDEVSTRLARRGHDVSVYCRKSNYDYTEAYYNGIRLVVLPSVKSKSLDTLSHSGLSTLHLLMSRWDVVHVYGLGNAVFLVLLKLFGFSTVISIDGLEQNRRKWGAFAKMWFRFSEFIVRRFADKVIADSNVIRKYYHEKHSVESAYIPYGAYVDVASNGDRLNEPDLVRGEYILFVGRLAPEKGVHYLIEAFRNVKTRMKLVIVGDDPYNSKYVESLKRNDDSRILFLGYVYGKRYADLCKNCYVYVQPSELEGTSPALLGAMGYGCCVVVNGIDENIETIGDAGISYKKNDVEDLTNKLQHLIDNPDITERYRKLAGGRIKSHYNWDRISDDIENLFTSISR